MDYTKSNSPLRLGDTFVYLPTTADQIILSDGTRLEQGGKLPWVLRKVSFDAVFESDGWSSTAPYIQTVIVNDVKVSDDLRADLDLSKATVDTFTDLNASWCLIDRLVCGDGQITAYCYTGKPTVNVPIHFSGIREV